MVVCAGKGELQYHSLCREGGVTAWQFMQGRGGKVW